MSESFDSEKRSAKSYYDLYPERKRTGPYVPKPALVAHNVISSSQSGTAIPSGLTTRRSRSGSQLGCQRKDTTVPPERKNRTALLTLPDGSATHQGGSLVSRSVSSTYAASSTALGRAKPHTSITNEPVKSIDEIVKAHSVHLLTAPPSRRGAQRSLSWSVFEPRSSDTQRAAAKTPSQGEADSGSESNDSEGSVEQEARSILSNARVDHLGRRMSQLTTGDRYVSETSARLVAPQKASSRTSSPSPFSPRRSLSIEADNADSSSYRRGLTRYMHVEIPGAPHLQVSFADVGLEHGRPVMVFLGLGASRHLVGLFDELAASFGLRLLCIDRWGIGRTDSVAADGRNILAWSFVVEQVANLLHISRFSILAHSAGAPFGVALALLFPHRVQGPLHLLAPWTEVQQDGYRWLRYIPDGVIKTAQAAEWRIQNWKLGKDGPRIANRSQTENDSSGVRQTNLDITDRKATPPLKQRSDRIINPEAELAVDSTGISPLDCYGDGVARNAGEGRRPVSRCGEQDSMLAEAERNSALELLKASHAESARGLVDDLQLILGKKPWGFGYTDLRLACEVWHGSKDERIPLSSSMNLSREMRDCLLHVVDGASHSLMTNSDVMVEVFESLRKHSGT